MGTEAKFRMRIGPRPIGPRQVSRDDRDSVSLRNNSPVALLPVLFCEDKLVTVPQFISVGHRPVADVSRGIRRQG